MKDTVLFGGSFDPVHIGHAMVANYVSQLDTVAEVWLMPGRINPLKTNHPLASDAQRLEMCRIIAADCRSAAVCDVEMSMPEPSFTSDTLRRLAGEFPNRRFALLIGSDNWLLFDRWHEADWILANHRIYIYPRPGYGLNAASLPTGVTLLADAPQALVSSTFVRNGFSRNANLNFFVPEKVLSYITKQNIYG